MKYMQYLKFFKIFIADFPVNIKILPIRLILGALPVSNI